MQKKSSSLSLIPPVKPSLPHIITGERAEVLLNSLQVGNTFRTACLIAEIDYDLFKRWMSLGGHPTSPNRKADVVAVADAEEPYKTFAARVMRAIGRAEANAVENLVAAGTRDWRASMAWLSRRNPEEWGEAPKNTAPVSIQQGNVQIFLPDNQRETPEIIETTGVITRELSSDVE